MKVATWNIRGWTNDKSLIVRSLLADHSVVGLTEIWNLPQEDPPFQVLSCRRSHVYGQKRGSGGVALAAPFDVPMRLLQSFQHKRFELLSASVYGCIVVAVYLSPRLSEQDMSLFFTELRKMARGRAIVMGDFNARHVQWDVTTTTQGRRLHDWATRANFRTVRPPSATFFSRHRNRQGATLTAASTVDLMFARVAALADPVVGEHDYNVSDHAPL